jgi:hypothetical protein
VSAQKKKQLPQSRDSPQNGKKLLPAIQQINIKRAQKIKQQKNT